MATPAKSRSSGLPGPKFSSLPTPGSRSRSSSVVGREQPAGLNADAEFMSRAFADAIKANDPAQHKQPRVSDSASNTLGPSSSQSTRAPSVAKLRPKTPSGARPPSRSSDVFGTSASRAESTFEVGDCVRIESLGMEGTLRYLGPIDGKAGIYAGVEVSGGFAGHGKNDGSAAGKRYFTCPPKCGVFVLANKLSPPSVRPSSVTSSVSGRTTPSVTGSLRNGAISSGRVTPSGRTTPATSAGRITPGKTPSAPSRQIAKPVPKTPVGKLPGPSLATQITPGSRASKYAGMTAQQLSAAQNGTSKQDPAMASPSRPGPLLSSPPINLPFGAPRAKSGTAPGRTSTPNKSRPSGGTPRARIPSAIAMPPPPSPSLGFSSPSRSVSRNSDLADGMTSMSEIARAGRALQERMAELTSSNTSITSSSPRPDSVASLRSEHRAQIERLQARLDALEYENERLRNAPPVTQPAPSPSPPPSPTPAPPPPPPSVDNSAELEAERDKFLSQISELEAKLGSATESIKESESKIESLTESHQKAVFELEKQLSGRSKAIEELQAKFDDAIIELKGLTQIVEDKEKVEREHEQLVETKDAEIAQANEKLTEERKSWEEERRDLNNQVNELRQAGQETIALYEEKLNAMEARRYELEARVSSLQSTLHRRTSSQASNAPAPAASAAEIDNETLREHVTHLQKRITTLEDQLEDAHASAERDEAAIHERLQRSKDKEDALKKEIAELKKNMDTIAKAELQARTRVEEVEEALRENSVALENARAEVETIRSEFADLDSLVGTSIEGDLHTRVAEFVERAAAEKKQYTDEIKRLQQLVESKNLQSKNGSEGEPVQSSEAERKSMEELQRALDERNAELDSLKKKLNREHGLSGPQSPVGMPMIPKAELASAKEEIKGLKHLIQELQKENSAAAQREQVLQSENQLLVSEAEHLRQEVKILEENLDTSVSNEDGTPMSPSLSSDVESLRTLLRDQKVKYEAELAQQRKKAVDAEQKVARTTHELNKEISELEALVEAKIYREDELEREIEKLKRQRKSSKSSTETLSRNSRASTASTISVDSPSQDVCEICEKPGHDIFNCDLLKADTQTQSVSNELYCEDCEGHGHVAANCPHSLDVF